MGRDSKFPVLSLAPALLWSGSAIAFMVAAIYATHTFELSRYAVTEQGFPPGLVFRLQTLGPAASAAFSGLMLLAAGAIVRVLLAIEENTRTKAPE